MNYQRIRSKLVEEGDLSYEQIEDALSALAEDEHDRKQDDEALDRLA